MKKITMTTLLLILLAGLFAQEEVYTVEDLVKYLIDVPGSYLPDKEQEVFIKSGQFTVEYEDDDSLGGKVYLVENAGIKFTDISYAKAIVIYSNEIKTRKVPAFQGMPFYIIFDQDIKIRFTGYFTTVINSRGKEFEAPIFVAK